MKIRNDGEVVAEHKAADAACGRAWVCACARCRAARKAGRPPDSCRFCLGGRVPVDTHICEPMPTRGGARKGAGRKPRRDTSATARITVPLAESERATLNARAAERGLTAAEAVRTALRIDRLID